MDILIKETDYISFNHLVQSRLQFTLPKEKHFYEYKKNRFQIHIKEVENDFIVMPSFQWNDDSFIENWLLYPYKIGESSITIESQSPMDIDELDNIIKMYGFKYSGQLQSYIPSEDLKEKITEYLSNYFASYCKYKVNFHFDPYSKCLQIRNFYESGPIIKVYFVEGGYWFIPSIPNQNTFAYGVCETVHFLLKQMDLISVFGRKK